MTKKYTVRTFKKRRESGKPFATITAYDAVTASIAQSVGIPLILVGDSVGMVVLGYDSTLPVTLEQIIHHTAAVRRGAPDTFIVADMPFMTYQTTIPDAMRNAARIIQEAGADAVKLEGDAEMAKTIRALVDAGLPVMAHIGLLPQQVMAKGGYFLRGKDEADIAALRADIQAVADAGAFSVVVEGVVPEVAAQLTELVDIPTIGIASGTQCDAQVQVINDLIGFTDRVAPKHARRYMDAAGLLREALERYMTDVAGE